MTDLWFAFVGDTYYPKPGGGDFVGVRNTQPDAIALARFVFEERRYDTERDGWALVYYFNGVEFERQWGIKSSD